MGTLTYELALRHKSVVALEIDRGLIPVLDYTLGEFDNVTVHNEDVMKADLDALLAPAFAEGPVSVCANLPYYITSPILMNFLFRVPLLILVRMCGRMIRKIVSCKKEETIL